MAMLVKHLKFGNATAMNSNDRNNFTANLAETSLMVRTLVTIIMSSNTSSKMSHGNLSLQVAQSKGMATGRVETDSLRKAFCKADKDNKNLKHTLSTCPAFYFCVEQKGAN